MPHEKLSLPGFVEEVKAASEGNLPRRFCLILGAGASKSSGIPDGSDLVKGWDLELSTRDPDGHAKWR